MIASANKNLPPSADTGFGYHAAASSSRRRKAPATLKSEDKVLDKAKRRAAVASARDIRRNSELAAWMIRKHLDFVATHTFTADTPDAGFNRDIEAMVSQAGQARNFDRAERHGLRRGLRILEACATLDGDVFGVKYRDGRLEFVESDRIRDREDARNRTRRTGDSPRVMHGIALNNRNAAIAYALHRRTDNGHEFSRWVPARDVIPHAHFAARFDQTRGISPLTSAINRLVDLNEGISHALAKAKVAQLFGLAVFRNADDPMPGGDVSETTDEDAVDKKFEVDFGNGTFLLDLEQDDKAEVLTEGTPSNEFQTFTQAVIALAMKALDLPYSFFDESHTNFFGSRAALLLYLKSCNDKRANVQDWLTAWHQWQIGRWIASGELTVPRSIDAATLLAPAPVGPLSWTPAGMPWWDTGKEVSGDLKAVEGGLRTRSEIRRERYGDDWRDVITQQKREEDFYLEVMGREIKTTAPEPAASMPSKRPGNEPEDTNDD